MAITIVMGFYDFVAGIVLGIFLACLIFVVQTSRISAIRATYSGAIVESTVRRHPVHRRFLHQVGSQIQVTKLAGYLFFGTIVAVEKNIRDMIDGDGFYHQPIRYLILDFTHVGGLDFSAAEAFVRIKRILRSKRVEMILSGVGTNEEMYKSLTMVGLLDEQEDSTGPPPRVFEDLNQALEACENDLLLALRQVNDTKDHTEASPTSQNLTIPHAAPPHPNVQFDGLFNSPRRNHVERAVATTLRDDNLGIPTKWQSFAQPLPLLLQAFRDVTTKDVDFWHQATAYFKRREFAAGTVLYSRGDDPDGFYLLEEGILRAEYEYEQGRFFESIVAGTTCGELPFFAETDRTGTVVAEKRCVAWLLGKTRWRDLERELPEVATELLKIGLKLTSERINSITS